MCSKECCKLQKCESFLHNECILLACWKSEVVVEFMVVEIVVANLQCRLRFCPQIVRGVDALLSCLIFLCA